MIDQLRRKAAPVAVLLANRQEEEKKVTLIAGLSRDLVERGLDAVAWVRAASAVVEGGGGGRPDMAQAGGKLPEKLPDALEAARARDREIVGSRVTDCGCFAPQTHSQPTQLNARTAVSGQNRGLFRPCGISPPRTVSLSSGMSAGWSCRRGVCRLYFEDGGVSMSKLGLLVLALCIGVFATGCQKGPSKADQEKKAAAAKQAEQEKEAAAKKAEVEQKAKRRKPRGRRGSQSQGRRSREESRGGRRRPSKPRQQRRPKKRQRRSRRLKKPSRPI